jgi:hypothetical protein
LLRGTLEAEFLFGKDIEDFLDELRKKAGDLYVVTTLIEDERELARRQEHQKRQHELQEWLGATDFETGKQFFGRYLRLVPTALDEKLAPMGE